MYNCLRVLTIAQLLVAFIGTAANADATPSSQTTPSPMQMFINTFQRLQSYPVPRYVVYLNAWRINYLPANADHAVLNCCDPRQFAIRMSDGMANESIPPLTGSALPIAAIGPAFEGLFPFSMRAADQAPQSRNALVMQPESPDAKALVTASAAGKPDYDVSLAGIDNIGGRPSYHLRLKALRDPGLHNLRELWTDTQTWDLMKARYSVMYAPNSMDPGPHGNEYEAQSPADLQVYFGPASSYWVAIRMVWTHGIFGDLTTYDVATAAAVFPAALPDWLFDPVAYAQHKRDGDLDYVSLLLSGKAVPQPSAAGVSAAPTPSPSATR